MVGGGQKLFVLTFESLRVEMLDESTNKLFLTWSPVSGVKLLEGRFFHNFSESGSISLLR